MDQGDDDVEIGRLTAAQKECLRLVMAGFKTKEIAHDLGIGVDAVNKRLSGARTTLGSPSRFHAARRLAAYEAGSAYHSTAGRLSAVDPRPSVADSHGHDDTFERDDAEASAQRVAFRETNPAATPLAPQPWDAEAPAGRIWPTFTASHVWAFAAAAGLGAFLRVVIRN